MSDPSGVCECGHLTSDHLEGSGLGEGCSGDVIIQNPGRPDIETPCSCEAFMLWYSDEIEGGDRSGE